MPVCYSKQENGIFSDFYLLLSNALKSIVSIATLNGRYQKVKMGHSPNRKYQEPILFQY